jgi:hypothetical protein
MKHIYSKSTYKHEFADTAFVGWKIFPMENEGKIFLRRRCGNHPTDSTSPHSTSRTFLAKVL